MTTFIARPALERLARFCSASGYLAPDIVEAITEGRPAPIRDRQAGSFKAFPPFGPTSAPHSDLLTEFLTRVDHSAASMTIAVSLRARHGLRAMPPKSR
jgi:hypothetical protein